ncbi:hypothetical protein RB195_009425 [Necator americanus]|uniref:Uncharacterized protein n=1 Tax=Necator americanus TaxID=51031 RepID=A0ABR1CUL0_NECAM
MEGVIEKLIIDNNTMEERVKAKEAILRGVLSGIEYESSDRRMIKEVLSVAPKVVDNPSFLSLKQSWCVGFEDSICVSYAARNASGRNHMEPTCHLLDNRDSVARCIVLDENGSSVSCVRSDSSADVLVGFSKSAFFSKSSCLLLLEFIQQPSPIKTSDGSIVSIPLITQPNTVEVHTLDVTIPRAWYSFADFISAKEHDMLLLLRCLRVCCYCYPIKPTSSFDFATANPDFDCCDFGEWQVFVGHKLMNGLVALSSTLGQSNGNIDCVYGLNIELLEQFLRRCSNGS